MAEGVLRSLDPTIEVHSAGTRPAEQVHPSAIAAMAEIGIDIRAHRPKALGRFLGQSFDYVITVCDQANESCPVFSGRVGRRLHFSFEDPAAVQGTPEAVLAAFRRIRDEIRRRFVRFHREELTSARGV
jgi:arsenate reductase (thioredoxin)